MLLVISVSAYVFITLYDFKVFYVLQPPIAVVSYRYTKILQRGQGNHSTGGTPNTPELWSLLTPVVGVQPCASSDSFILYTDCILCVLHSDLCGALFLPLVYQHTLLFYITEGNVTIRLAIHPSIPFFLLFIWGKVVVAPG